MANVPLFWVIAVGLTLAVVRVVGGLARMRGQRRHVRAMLRDTFKRRRGQKRSSRDASASGRGGRRLLTRRPAPRGIASGSASQLPVSVCLLRREARQESPAQCDEPGSGLLSVVELLTQPGVGGAMHVLRLRREVDLTGLPAESLANSLGLAEEPKREPLALAPVDQLVARPTPERAPGDRELRRAPHVSLSGTHGYVFSIGCPW